MGMKIEQGCAEGTELCPFKTFPEKALRFMYFHRLISLHV